MLDDVDFRPASVEVDGLRVDSTVHKFFHASPIVLFLRIVDAVFVPSDTAPGSRDGASARRLGR
jgi:hypothetical protein